MALDLQLTDVRNVPQDLLALLAEVDQREVRTLAETELLENDAFLDVLTGCDADLLGDVDDLALLDPDVVKL